MCTGLNGLFHRYRDNRVTEFSWQLFQSFEKSVSFTIKRLQGFSSSILADWIIILLLIDFNGWSVTVSSVS
jgi:hypothetical protein